MSVFRIVLLACAALATQAEAALPDVIFSLGKDDGSPAEFALAQGAGWQKFAAAFKQPVAVDAGGSAPERAWPYIHPNTRDNWAGGRTHPFTIRFALPEAPTGALTLVIGQVNALGDPTIAVTANGREVRRVAAPAGSGDASGRAEGKMRPDRTLIPIPADRFRAGPNELAITLENGSWIIYDYVLLCSKVPPAYAPPDIAPRAVELRSGVYGLFSEIVFATRNNVSDGH